MTFTVTYIDNKDSKQGSVYLQATEHITVDDSIIDNVGAAWRV